MILPGDADLRATFARTVVVGCSGSGKSTFARAAAAALAVPHVHLDELYWGPGWQPRPAAEFAADAAAATLASRWIVDGNYRGIRDIVWPRATAIVWLDLPFPLVFGRTLARTLRRVATRAPLYAGNRESLRRTFLSRESILWWVVTQHHRYRRNYRSLYRAPGSGSPAWFALRRPREVRALLRQLEAAAVTPAD